MRTGKSTIAAVFDGCTEGTQAATALSQAGFASNAISITAMRCERDGAPSLPLPEILTTARYTLPGIGPVSAGGPLAASFETPLRGGFTGALERAGIPEEEAHYYAEAVRRGCALVLVDAPEGRADEARELLDAQGALDVDELVSDWRHRGWAGHNPGVEPMSEDEIRRERAHYRKHAERRYEPAAMTSKERIHTDASESGTNWPHREAYDIGDSLRTITPAPGSAPHGARVYEQD